MWQRWDSNHHLSNSRPVLSATTFTPYPLYPGLCDWPISYCVMHSTLPRGSSRNGRTFLHTVRWRISVHCSGPSCHVPLPLKLPTSTPSLIAVAVLQGHQTVPSSIWPHTHPSAQELHKYRKDCLSGSLDTRSIQRNCSKGFFTFTLWKNRLVSQLEENCWKSWGMRRNVLC